MKAPNIIVSSILASLIAVGLVVYVFLFHVPFGWFINNVVGATVTTLNSTDNLSDFPTTYNANLTALNNRKIEVSTTTLPLLTGFGVVATGTWRGATLGVPYGGTGSTTLSSNQVLLGNGVSGFKTVAGWGSSGQSLVSNGGVLAPTWQSVGVNQGSDYSWTGTHSFTTGAVTFATTTTTNATTSTFAILTKRLHINGISYFFPSVDVSSSTSLSSDGSGNLKWVDYRDLTVTKYASEAGGGGFGSAASEACSTTGNICYMDFTNNADDLIIYPFRVPRAATGISSIKVIYKRDSTGNLYLRFHTSKVDNDASGSSITEDDTDTATTYAGGASDGTTGLITVPSGAYNGLSGVDEGDLLNVMVLRDGTNGSDTYEASWNVIGVQVIFQ